MKTWTIHDAQSRFTDMLQSSSKEPQIICDRDKAVGVLVNITFFQEFVDRKKRSYRPTIEELLDELDEIMTEAPIDIEIPERQDRPNSLFEAADEILV